MASIFLCVAVTVLILLLLGVIHRLADIASHIRWLQNGIHEDLQRLIEATEKHRAGVQPKANEHNKPIVWDDEAQPYK